jgi:hypothetical protein
MSMKLMAVWNVCSPMQGPHLGGPEGCSSSMVEVCSVCRGLYAYAVGYQHEAMTIVDRAELAMGYGCSGEYRTVLADARVAVP